LIALLGNQYAITDSSRTAIRARDVGAEHVVTFVKRDSWAAMVRMTEINILHRAIEQIKKLKGKFFAGVEITLVKDGSSIRETLVSATLSSLKNNYSIVPRCLLKNVTIDRDGELSYNQDVTSSQTRQTTAAPSFSRTVDTNNEETKAGSEPISLMQYYENNRLENERLEKIQVERAKNAKPPKQNRIVSFFHWVLESLFALFRCCFGQGNRVRL
jgi:hypothetical protein